MNSLYREEIMEHYKHPQNKGSLASPTKHLNKVNPLCGDEIALDIKIDNGVIADVAFDGSACAVSIVGSSLLTEYIKGRTVEDVKKMSKQDVLKLVDMNLSTSRIKCATLCFEAVQEALNDIKK